MDALHPARGKPAVMPPPPTPHAPAHDAADGDDFLRKDNALAAGLRWLWLAVLSWGAFAALGLWVWRWWP